MNTNNDQILKNFIFQFLDCRWNPAPRFRNLSSCIILCELWRIIRVSSDILRGFPQSLFVTLEADPLLFIIHQRTTWDSVVILINGTLSTRGQFKVKISHLFLHLNAFVHMNCHVEARARSNGCCCSLVSY